MLSEDHFTSLFRRPLLQLENWGRQIRSVLLTDGGSCSVIPIYHFECASRLIKSLGYNGAITLPQHAPKKGFLLFSGGAFFRFHFQIEAVISVPRGR